MFQSFHICSGIWSFAQKPSGQRAILPKEKCRTEYLSHNSVRKRFGHNSFGKFVEQCFSPKIFDFIYQISRKEFQIKTRMKNIIPNRIKIYSFTFYNQSPERFHSGFLKCVQMVENLPVFFQTINSFFDGRCTTRFLPNCGGDFFDLRR